MWTPDVVMTVFDHCAMTVAGWFAAYLVLSVLAWVFAPSGGCDD